MSSNAGGQLKTGHDPEEGGDPDEGGCQEGKSGSQEG